MAMLIEKDDPEWLFQNAQRSIAVLEQTLPTLPAQYIHQDGLSNTQNDKQQSKEKQSNRMAQTRRDSVAGKSARLELIASEMPQMPTMFPTLPQNQKVDVQQDPAYHTTGGPTCLIREPLCLPSRRHPLCPHVVYDALKSSLTHQQHNQFKQALQEIKFALEIWRARKQWRDIEAGKDPLAALEEEHENDCVQADQKSHQSEQVSQNSPKAAFDEKSQSFDNDSALEMSVDISDDVVSNGASAAPLSPYSFSGVAVSELPNVSVEDEYLMLIYIYNAIANIYESQGNELHALLVFSEARCVHDWLQIMLDRNYAHSTHVKDNINDFQDETKNENIKNNNEASIPPKPTEEWLLQRAMHMSGEVINPYSVMSSAEATTYNYLGSALFHLGNFQTAMRCFCIALQVRLSVLQPESAEFVDVATPINNIGACLASMKCFNEALHHFEGALQLLTSRLDAVHPRVTIVRANIEKIRPRTKQISTPKIVLQLNQHRQAIYNAAVALAIKNQSQKNKGRSRPGKDEVGIKDASSNELFFQVASQSSIMPLRKFEVTASKLQQLKLQYGKKPSNEQKGKKK